jgi:hypothetical protein
MAENLLFVDEVPDCTDAEILDWQRKQGDYIRRVVGNSLCLRYLPYRKNMVGIDFFGCETLQGPSVEVNIHIDGTRRLVVQEEDIVHVSMPDYPKAMLLASMLSIAAGRTKATKLIVVP